MEQFTFETERPELTEAEREVVEKIEKLPCPDNEKTDLLLIWRGLKSATDIEYGKDWYPEEKPITLTQEEIDQLTNAIRHAGFYATEPVHEDQKAERITEGPHAPYVIPGKDQIRIFVASDQKTAERLQIAHGSGDARTYGKLSGYPQTAIEAFVEAAKRGEEGWRELLVYRDELPDEVKNQDFLAFAEFKLSKAHWQDELKTVKKWAEEIQRINPALYSRNVEAYKSDLAKGKS